MRERLSYYDNIKGILIALVVIGHLLEPLTRMPLVNSFGFALADSIYLFHMPLFVFVTGLFSKSVFRDGVYRSEVPIYYFTVCFLLYGALVAEKALLGSAISVNFLTLNGRIPWYLMAAGFYVMGVPFFSRIRPAFAIAGSIALAVLTGLVEGTNMLSATRVITFLPYFLAGYYLDPKAIVAFKERFGGAKGPSWFCLAFILVIVLEIAFFCMCDDAQKTFFFKMFYGKLSYEEALSDSGLHISLWLCMVVRLVHYGAVCVVGIGLLAAIPTGFVPILTKAGKRSLQIYLLHPFVYYYLNSIHFSRSLQIGSDVVSTLVLVLLGVVVATVLSLPAAPQRWLDSLKAAIGKFVGGGSPRFAK